MQMLGKVHILFWYFDCCNCRNALILYLPLHTIWMLTQLIQNPRIVELETLNETRNRIIERTSELRVT